MGDLHLVLLAFNLSNPECWHFDNDATSKIDGPWDFSVSPSPLVLGLGLNGLVPGLDNTSSFEEEYFLVQVWQKFQWDSGIYLKASSYFVFVCFEFPYHLVSTELKEGLTHYCQSDEWDGWPLHYSSDWAWCWWCDVIDIPPPPLSSSGLASAIIQLDCLLIITRNNANQGGQKGLQHGLWLVNRSQPRNSHWSGRRGWDTRRKCK